MYEYLTAMSLFPCSWVLTVFTVQHPLCKGTLLQFTIPMVLYICTIYLPKIISERTNTPVISGGIPPSTELFSTASESSTTADFHQEAGHCGQLRGCASVLMLTPPTGTRGAVLSNTTERNVVSCARRCLRLGCCSFFFSEMYSACVLQASREPAITQGHDWKYFILV